MVELSKAQDIEAGDGTTSVVVVAGSLLTATQKLLNKGIPFMHLAKNSLTHAQHMIGIHPTTISESFQKASEKAVEVLNGMSTAVELSDKESLLKSATTSLSSKVIIV